MQVWEMIERLQELDASLEVVIDADNVSVFREADDLFPIDRVLVGGNAFGTEVVILRI
jgi:hypothetical protein